ncbi:cupin domain-containing protein [Kineococcus sp. TBRC 1896]|uniref:Cupin domain-containing protein n=1 Tax=Kineococcus mangrovi TaxID=1660183 RepID=A0ABV4I0L6_9ACTN
MRHRSTVPAAILLGSALGLAACSGGTDAETPDRLPPAPDAISETTSTPPGPSLELSPSAERTTTTGAAENFTGTVRVTPLFDPTDASTAGAGLVTFEPGARTAWHTHPAGQRIVITAGTGWVQERGGERLEVRAGDVVWFAPGVEHWHGATATDPMTHVAVQDTVDGSNATWEDLVTDEEYTGG